MELDDILKDRGEQYGEFDKLAEISQDLKEVIGCTAGWEHLAVDQREALEMVAHKIARILNGDPERADTWIDIAGYAKLVADRLAAGEPIETNYGTEEKPVSQKKVKKALRTLMRAGIVTER